MESIFNYTSPDGNCEANLIGEFIGDTDSVENAELLLQEENLSISLHTFSQATWKSAITFL